MYDGSRHQRALLTLLAAAAPLLTLAGCKMGSGGDGGGGVAPSVTSTLQGQVIATNGRGAITGATITLAGTTAQSGSDGSFTLTTSGTGTGQVSVSGPTLLTHRTFVSIANRTITLDAIRMEAPFDLGFYREFVRNGRDAPDSLEPLRRWTSTPKFYIRNVDDGGRQVNGQTLATAERMIRETAPVLTDGQLAPTVFEQGADTREGQAGWVTVRWVPGLETSLGDSICGRSLVGGGLIELNTFCSCPGYTVRPRVIRHEVGHMLGFRHTSGAGDLMNTNDADCDRLPSARERYHAAIAYRRPPGNVEPDDDPSGTVTLRTSVTVD